MLGSLTTVKLHVARIERKKNPFLCAEKSNYGVKLSVVCIFFLLFPPQNETSLKD